MNPAWFLLLLALVDARQKPFDDDDNSGEESDSEWERKACSAYNNCLQTYDERIEGCGRSKDKEPDVTDACYEPVRKYFSLLLNRRERRNQLMRDCFETGRIEGKREKRDKYATVPSTNKRHRSVCRTKFAELEQFLKPKEKLGKHKKYTQSLLGSESCHAAAKRLKERCQKIENCCPRVKSCRQKVGQHTVVEQMREIETRIREERRMCMENS